MYEHIGCFTDKGGRERSIGAPDTKVSSKYAIKECYSKANEVGSHYFAIQNDNECRVVSSELDQYGKYGPSLDCRNGKGGHFANDVYIVKGKIYTRYMVTR